MSNPEHVIINELVIAILKRFIILYTFAKQVK